MPTGIGSVAVAELLSFYDKDMKWIIEPGDFTIMAGTSSDKTQDIKLSVVKYPGDLNFLQVFTWC